MTGAWATDRLHGGGRRAADRLAQRVRQANLAVVSFVLLGSGLLGSGLRGRLRGSSLLGGKSKTLPTDGSSRSRALPLVVQYHGSG
eukprot:6787493-Prymnesium_polylepis.1